jgi:hypothetical protein
MTVWAHLNIFLLAGILLLRSCTKSDDKPENWQPEILNDGWQISGDEKQNLDSNTLNILYKEADKLDNLYSLLVIKNGFLIAEKYSNGKSVTDASSTITNKYENL